MNLDWLNGNRHNIYVYGACFVGSATTLYFMRKYFLGPMCLSEKRLEEKVVIITGANTGIGKETAIDLAKRGATVIIACRDEKKGAVALSEIREKSKNPNVFLKILNLSSLESIKKFSEQFLQEYQRLDILINNAGVCLSPNIKTENGFEINFGTNHLGHFALTNLLLVCLKESAPSRIVNVSSGAHLRINRFNFDVLPIESGNMDVLPFQNDSLRQSIDAYAQSKLANILFTKELDKKLHFAGVSVFALTPGFVSTEIARFSRIIRCCFFLLKFFQKSPKYGAQTTIYCAVQENIEIHSGMYFRDCKMSESSTASYHFEDSERLWEVSEKLTGIKYPLYNY